MAQPNDQAPPVLDSTSEPILENSQQPETLPGTARLSAVSAGELGRDDTPGVLPTAIGGAHERGPAIATPPPGVRRTPSTFGTSESFVLPSSNDGVLVGFPAQPTSGQGSGNEVRHAEASLVPAASSHPPRSADSSVTAATVETTNVVPLPAPQDSTVSAVDPTALVAAPAPAVSISEVQMLESQLRVL